ncbi:hypothetical protein I7I53_03898 [Histoplasma capsulatum var. duboisii H88]|uniref:Uncharacterized protein n=1 Tax=Ajellomyces capsulatus (strain H88) TaxID=544711 RepID=A0A8A1LPH2_AJEC8|nr:hypothetical protein I7I53_03898 [Histoplasma capsulatum var. duboisii H88]
MNEGEAGECTCENRNLGVSDLDLLLFPFYFILFISSSFFTFCYCHGIWTETEAETEARESHQGFVVSLLEELWRMGSMFGDTKGEGKGRIASAFDVHDELE